MSYPFVALVLFPIPILMYLLAFRHPLLHANLQTMFGAKFKFPAEFTFAQKRVSSLLSKYLNNLLLFAYRDRSGIILPVRICTGDVGQLALLIQRKTVKQFWQVCVDKKRKSEITDLLPSLRLPMSYELEWKIAHSCLVCAKTLDKDERRAVHTESGEIYIEILLLSAIAHPDRSCTRNTGLETIHYHFSYLRCSLNISCNQKPGQSIHIFSGFRKVNLDLELRQE